MSDWIVSQSSWGGYEALPVVKQTAKQVIALSHNRHRHIPAGDVIAVLSEAAAMALRERLVSSANRCKDEIASANQRHRDRVAALKAEHAK
jgi:hypothetical protein